MIHFLAQLRFDGAVTPHRSIAGRHWGDTARLWQQLPQQFSGSSVRGSAASLVCK